jgi:hypothetical protein
MARFTTRVELHDEQSSDYPKLHKAMEGQGFTQFIPLENGRYKMPTAEYNYEGSVNKSDVLAKAVAAAKTVRPKFDVLVTESSGRIWHPAG